MTNLIIRLTGNQKQVGLYLKCLTKAYGGLTLKELAERKS